MFSPVAPVSTAAAAGHLPGDAAPSTSTSAGPSTTSTTTAPRKPKRIQNVSCDACRIRKVKCDRAPRIAQWRIANQHLPHARDLTYRPGTDTVWCSLCSEHGIPCTLTIKPPKRRIGKRLAALKAARAGVERGDEDDEEEADKSSASGGEDDDALHTIASTSYRLAQQPAGHARSSKRRRISHHDDDEHHPGRAATPSHPAYEEIYRRRGPTDAVYMDPHPHLAANLPAPRMAAVSTPTGMHNALLPPQAGLFGVPRLSKSVLDAAVVGFFSGPCVCPAIVKYEEILPRYRTYWRRQWVGSSSSSSDAGAAVGIGPNAGDARRLFDHTGAGDDSLPPIPTPEDMTGRFPTRDEHIIPLPAILTIAIALAGCGQLDKELYPYKLLLQRDLALCWKELAYEYVHTVDLGLDFCAEGAQARVDCHEAQDALDAMLIVGAQDFEFMASEAEVALKALYQRAWDQPDDDDARRQSSALRAEHLKYQRALLFHIRGTTLEGTLRFAYKMGINRNPLHSIVPPSTAAAARPTTTTTTTMSLVTRIRRTREWWSIFSSDAFHSLASRKPLLIGDHDFDVPLPSFRPGPDGTTRIVSGFAPRAPAAAASDGAPAQDQRTASGPAPTGVYPGALPSSFDVNWMNTLFSLAFLGRGMSRRFVSVRVQGQGVNVLDALNSIEVLERFYRGIPDELRWETQDARLMGILAELYPPQTAGRAAAAAAAAAAQHQDSGTESERRPSGPDGSTSDASRPTPFAATAAATAATPTPAVRRRRVPNSLRATSRAFRDGIQSLFLESLLASVVVCIGGAVKDFGFRRPVRNEGSDPLSVVEAMLSGQLRENPFFRIDQDSAASEPRFLQTLKDDVAAQKKTRAGHAFDSRADAAWLAQQRSVEDVTVERLYTLQLRFFFRAAKIYREGAEHGFLSARHNTFGSIAAVWALWGVKHVDMLAKAMEDALAAGGTANGPGAETKGTSQPSPATAPAPPSQQLHPPDTRRGLPDNPHICRRAAAETNTSVEDAKQAVRDLLEALATTIDADTRVEPLVRALRASIQVWDEAEVRELLERHQQAAARGRDTAAGEKEGRPVYVDGREPIFGSSEWYRLASLTGRQVHPDSAAPASSNTAAPPPPPFASSSSMGDVPASSASGFLATEASQAQTQGDGEAAQQVSAAESLGLDPFADLSQFPVSFGADTGAFVPGGASQHGGGGGLGSASGGPTGPFHTGGGGGGSTATTSAPGGGFHALPPIGHLAGTSGAVGLASSTYDFDRAVQEMLAAAAMGQQQQQSIPGGVPSGGGPGTHFSHLMGSGGYSGEGPQGSYAAQPTYGPGGAGSTSTEGTPLSNVDGSSVHSRAPTALHSAAGPSGANVHHGTPAEYHGQRQSQPQQATPHHHLQQQPQTQQPGFAGLSPVTLALSSLPPLSTQDQPPSSMDWLARLAQGFF